MSKFDRFKDAPWFRSIWGRQLVVGGAGGISSWLVLMLSRMGVVCTVFDDDSFEEHNIGGQFVRTSQIGVSKVAALKENVKDFTGTKITALNQKFDSSSIVSTIMFSGFDNMQARRTMFNKWKANNGKLLIDGRLLFEQIQIYCVTPQTAQRYEEEALFDDSQVGTEACTMKQTSHTAMLIASLMTCFFTNYITNIVRNNDACIVPYYYELYTPVMSNSVIICRK